MTLLRRPATADGLFLWVMHQFAGRFEERAIIKGGMALRLLDSPRSTTDIDYVFAPFESKRAVAGLIEDALSDLEDADRELDIHSRMIRVRLSVDNARIQIEISVESDCPSVAMATGGFARSLGQPSRVVAVIDTDRALSDKLAAWNERRLMRDLYDCYFLSSRVGAQIDWARLDSRLGNLESRRPELRQRSEMSRREFAAELRAALDGLDQSTVSEELSPLLPPEELAGLALRLKASVGRLCERLESG